MRSRRGASNALIIEALRRRVRWACSVPLFFEYEDALARAELLLAVGASRQAMETFLTDIAAVIEPVALHFLWRPQLRDPKDEMVVETAANARADYLVTHNIADFAAVRNRFTFDIVTPRELITRIEL